MGFLFRFSADFIVVPEPAKGSRTESPSEVDSKMQLLGIWIGNGAG